MKLLPSNAKARSQHTEDQGTPRWEKITILLCLLTLTAVIIWACYAKLDRVVRASGQFVPANRTYIVQNLEGGMIRSLHVREGDEVVKGQLLLELDTKEAKGALDLLWQQINTMHLKEVRLRHELAYQDSLAFQSGEEILSLKEAFSVIRKEADDKVSNPDNISENDLTLFLKNDTEDLDFTIESDDDMPPITYSSVLADSERELYSARRQDYFKKLTGIVEELKVQIEQVATMEHLVSTNFAVPRLQLLQARAELKRLETGFYNEIARSQRETAEELSEIIAEKEKLEQSLAATNDQLVRTSIHSPTNGSINQLFFKNAGGVVGPREPILEITPADGDILVEVRVGPEDIGYVRKGMASTLKITAYDYTIYGALSGEVVRVGADSVPHPDDPSQPPSFLVMVKIDPEELKNWKARSLEVRPGMVVEAELIADQTRVIEYILKPVMRARDALKEI